MQRRSPTRPQAQDTQTTYRRGVVSFELGVFGLGCVGAKSKANCVREMDQGFTIQGTAVGANIQQFGWQKGAVVLWSQIHPNKYRRRKVGIRTIWAQSLPGEKSVHAWI